MAVQKRGKSYYASWYEKVDGTLKNKKKAFKKKSDASAYLGKMKTAQRENRLFDIKKDYTHTFSELLERYQGAFKDQKSFKDKKHHFPLFDQVFGGRKLAEITPYDLEQFRNKRKNTPCKCALDKVRAGLKIREKHPIPPRERKPATVNRELSTLRHMLSKAVEWGMMESSPFSKTKKLFIRENNQRVRYLSDIEEFKLLQACCGYLKDIVIVALNSGMRKGEILSLTWPQIRNGFIYLTKTKTDKARHIPINETLKRLFASLSRHRTSDYIFHRHDGTPYRDVIKSFNTAVRGAGIEDFHFHDLRHSFASSLVMNGTSIQAVQKLLGHTKLDMTLRYAHLADDFLIDAVRVLDEKSKNKIRTVGDYQESVSVVSH